MASWKYHSQALETPLNKSGNWTLSRQLVLLDNVQFIYELALAQLELQSLGVKFEITNGLREFRLLDANNEEELRRKLAYFKIVGGNIQTIFKLFRKIGQNQ